jgi:ubiquinone/menaquinone biosynthesis C-methylase UbiE
MGATILGWPLRRHRDLIDMAGVRRGMRVLDVACGAGNQSIQVARRVGSSGHVIATDISAAMLEYAGSNAAGLKTLNSGPVQPRTWISHSQPSMQQSADWA